MDKLDALDGLSQIEHKLDFITSAIADLNNDGLYFSLRDLHAQMVSCLNVLGGEA
jgi:hypothetical protein